MGFGWVVFVPIVAVWVAVFLHERRVSESKRIMIGWVPLQRKACQLFCTWQSCLACTHSLTFVVPFAASLDLHFEAPNLESGWKPEDRNFVKTLL